MDGLAGKGFGVSPEEEVTCAEEAPLYNQLPEDKKQYSPFMMGPVALWGSSRGGRLLYGVLHNKSRKLLKEKVS